MQCPQCQHDNQPGAKFCVECASPVERRRCPACGTEAAPTAKFCPECAAPLTAKSAPAGLTPGQSSAPTDAGERRHLTALFCDLVGSTDIASRIDPEEWHRISKAYQEAAAAAVTRFGGHVDKFLGDGLVCFFGVPQAHEDDAERAVRAGLAIVDAVHGLNGNATGQAPELRVRVGLHTGSAVVAHGGGASKDVFGDTPNIAARVQGVAEPDTVVISAATQRLVAGLFVVEERGAQQLKGVPQPVVLYRVVQQSGMRSRLDVSAGRHTPFVGRQSELSVLADAWERVVEGIGQTVLVQGEAGIGKSRLCYQLREQLGDQPHTWLECRCSPYTTGTPFRPVIELVDQALTFQLTDTPADKLGKLQIGLERGGVAGDETVALLAEWLELPESAGYTTRSINPDVKRRKTLELLAAWNFKLAELQPMVVMVEDLHWCDPSSLELLGRLVAQSATAHVLLVGTARPEFASPWPARSNLQTVSLGRLTEPQTREMIAALSAARALPETVVEQLVARADGIPLFAEELTQAVVEAGGDAAVAEIPVTLQDSLLARLDRISSAKEVAQRAAVLGREFSYALLAATAGLDEEALQHRLARLVEAELIFVRGEPPEATYTFKHALVQEAAYESLLKRARLSLHGTVVDALLRDFPERVAAEPEVLAQHAELAGRIGEAIAFYQRAGEREKQRFAHEEAITDLRRALDLLARQPEGTEHDAREVAIQLALAGSLVVAKGLSHPEPQIAYDRARILCEKQLDERLLCLASIGLSILSFARGEVEQGRSLAARVITTAEQMGDQELALLGHIQVAIPENFQGKLVSSLAHLRVARSLYQPDRHHAVVSILFTDPGVSTLAFMGAVLEGLGWRDQGLARAREGVELARRLGHPSSLAQALFFETTIHWARRDPDAQRERAAETIALAEAQGLPYFLGLGRTFHAGARVAAGELGAIADVLAGVEFAAGAGNLGGAPASFVLLGEAHLAAGQPADALGVVDMGLALSAQTGQAFFDAELHRLRGEIWLRRSDDAPEQIESEKRAEACFHDALDVAIAQELKPFELRASTSLARLWWDQGKRTEARDLLAPVYGWFTEGFDTRDLIDAKAILEEL